jgi:Arc/MetJ-type ribon-helix-helix transcriptional regulator
MSIDLSHDAERLANDEVAAGRFQTPQEFIDTAIKHFLIAREFGETEARKIAVLRAELDEADAQIDRGDCADFDEHTLDDLFREVEAEGLQQLSEDRAAP